MSHDRGVEVLNNGNPSGALPEGGVVDLTGQNKGPVVDLTGDSNANQEPTTPLVEGDEGYVPPGEPVVPKLDADGNPMPDAPKDPKEPEAPAEGEFFFGGESVIIEVPSEISSALTEAGLDEKAVMAELFAKDGKFELTADTRAKLDEKFGKLMVDGYLKMYKGLNEQTLAEAAKQLQTQTEAQKAVMQEYQTIVGGEEGLTQIEAYVLTLDEKQIASYNAVMGGDSWDAQKMVLGMIREQMAVRDKQINGDKTISLLGDGDPASNLGSGDATDKGWISGAEFQQIMGEDKYWTDKAYQKKVDTMRSASLKAGR